MITNPSPRQVLDLLKSSAEGEVIGVGRGGVATIARREDCTHFDIADHLGYQNRRDFDVYVIKQ